MIYKWYCTVELCIVKSDVTCVVNFTKGAGGYLTVNKANLVLARCTLKNLFFGCYTLFCFPSRLLGLDEKDDLFLTKWKTRYLECFVL